MKSFILENPLQREIPCFGRRVGDGPKSRVLPQSHTIQEPLRPGSLRAAQTCEGTSVQPEWLYLTRRSSLELQAERFVMDSVQKQEETGKTPIRHR